MVKKQCGYCIVRFGDECSLHSSLFIASIFDIASFQVQSVEFRAAINAVSVINNQGACHCLCYDENELMAGNRFCRASCKGHRQESLFLLFP